MKSQLNVQTFADYRTFLVAHAQYMKRAKPRWSYGSWARTLGLSNTSSITKIIQGSRNPGDSVTDKLVRYFEFQGKDADYFRDLIQLQKIRGDSRLKVMLLERINAAHPQGAARLLDEKTFSVIANWYHLALRELVRLGSFVDDDEWISKKMKFKVSPRECRQALERLLALGLLVRDASGKLAVAENTLNTTSDVASEAIRRYHEQMIENARLSVREVSVDERELTGASLVVKTSDLPRAKEMIREFRRNFARTFETPEGDAVYQLQLQLFPLTNKGDTHS